MKILVIGDDGRASALGSLLAKQHKLVFAPGNSVTALYGKTKPEYSLAGPFDAIRQYEEIDFAIATRVESSASGSLDLLRADIPVFGPGKEGAALELSKLGASDICLAHGMAAHMPRQLEIKYPATYSQVLGMTRRWPEFRVVKNDGLAQGKGVTIGAWPEDTAHAVMAMLSPECRTVVLEEYIDGIEISFTAAVHSDMVLPLFTVFEHKLAYTGNLGPMTAEMGSVVIAGMPVRPLAELFAPLKPFFMKTGYNGLLDINCMYDKDTNTLKILEFTCRFGDPTTEIMLPMLKKDIDLGRLLHGWATGNMTSIDYEHDVGVGIVYASGGYPYKGACVQGAPIWINPDASDECLERLWPMSAARDVLTRYVTSGGRQFIGLGYGAKLTAATGKAYETAEHILFRDMMYRLDIGTRVHAMRDTLYTAGLVQWGVLD